VDLKEIGYELVSLARDRFKSRDVLNTVMDLGVA
jgi:hypothetical protein